MGWEERNGRMYYYRKRREGRRVISEYLGNGLAAELSSRLDREDQHESRLQGVAGKTEKAEATSLDAHAKRFYSTIDAIISASLVLSGFHTHKGQWRKRRNV